MESNTTIQEKPDNKVFNKDFSQKLLLLVATFLLSTLLGGLLGYYFQARTNSRNYKNSLIESERKAAKDIFEDIITGIDERIYYAQIVNDAHLFNEHKKGISPEKWNNYVKAMDKWNININKRFQLMLFYFGYQTKKDIQVIHLKFISLNSKLNSAKASNDQAIHNIIKSDIAEINKANADLSVKLIRLIQQDSIGRIPNLYNL